MYEFDADPGQTVALDQTLNIDARIFGWKLEDRWGRVVVGNFGAMYDLGPVKLLGSRYEVAVFGSEEVGMGAYEFRLVDGNPQEFTISIGDTVPGEIPADKPAQQDVYMFTALPNQRVFLDLVSQFPGMNWKLFDARGRTLLPQSRVNDVGPFALTGGEYFIVVLTENLAETGPYSFRIVEPVVETSPVFVGDMVAGSIDSPAAQDIYTFTAPANQSILLELAFGFERMNWELVDAYGRAIIPRIRATDTGPDPIALIGGNYRLTVLQEVAGGAPTGPYQFQIVDEGTATYTPSGEVISVGQLVPGTIDPAGEINSYIFDVAEGEKLYFDVHLV